MLTEFTIGISVYKVLWCLVQAVELFFSCENWLCNGDWCIFVLNSSLSVLLIEAKVPSVFQWAAMQYQREGNDEQSSTSCIHFNTWYIRKGWSGRLKIMEVIATLIAAVSLPTDETTVKYTFFRVVAWTAFAVAVLDLILHLSNLWEKIHVIFTAAEALMSFAALTGFLFLIASGLLADIAPRSKHVTSNTIALVAGFFAASFYGVEALLHFLVFRTTDPKFPPASDFSVVMWRAKLLQVACEYKTIGNVDVDWRTFLQRFLKLWRTNPGLWKAYLINVFLA